MAPIRYTSRNDTLGFAHRTRKNLEHIAQAYANGLDVHVVTQLAISLLGLIVYPRERKLVERFRTLNLSELQASGWPSWHIEVGQPKTLYQLIRVLRNAIAHGHVHFSSDDRDIDNVRLRFENYDGAKLTWRATITAPDLDNFCRQFIQLIDSEIG